MKSKNMIIPRLITASLIALIFTACRKDLLVTTPIDRISKETFWKTDADATGASTAIYTFMDGTNPNNVPLVTWDGLTDVGHFNQPSANENRMELGVADALNARFEEQWITGYKGIGLANTFLQNVGNITVTNQTLVNTRKGEVIALRAYYYLKLVSWFGAVPLITHSITIEEGTTVPRTDATKVYDFIASELDTAIALLPTTQTDPGRLTKGAALALKARASLYAGRYAEAAAAAKSVMNLNIYTLYPKYSQLFSYAAENNSEVIWDKQFIKDLYANNVFGTLSPASMASAQAVAVPTKQLGDEFEMTNGKMITDPTSGFDPTKPYVNRDPRMGFTMFRPGDLLPNGKIYNSVPGSGTADGVAGGNLYATTTGYNVRKYVNAEDIGTPNNCGINIIFIRYPEVLLTYAEAKIELNQLDQSVYDALNLIRRRSDVNMPVIPSGLSQAQLRTAVRHERVVELAFEGLHLFDIRRWKTAAAVLPGAVQGITYLKNGVLTTVSNNSSVRVFNPERDYLWPIPQQERIINPNLTQNPNW